MNVLLALVIAVIAGAVAAAPTDEIAISQLTAFDYHRRVGIPAADRIRRAEAEAAKDPSRIVGGIIVGINEHPYQCGLLISVPGGLSICGATVLSNTRAITAAHCWTDGNSQALQITVVLGSTTLFSGGTRIDTNQVAVHPNWNPSTLAYDVAIIIHPYVGHGGNIWPIRLPSGNELNSNFAGEWATASGFGGNYDGQQGIPNNQELHRVNIQIITNPVCQQTYGNFIQDNMLCTSGAGGVGTCGGDSGGPLTTFSGGSKVLVGVISFVSAAGCQTGAPAGYGRVTSFIGWIHQNL